MRIALIESQADPASQGIAEALRRRTSWHPTSAHFEGRPIWAYRARPGVELIPTPLLHIHAEAFDESLAKAGHGADLIVFLSRHRAESGRPALTVHPIGNYGPNELGGRPQRLSPALGAYQTHALRCLKEAQAAASYPAEVTFEATHHGPWLSTPAFFWELGSSEAQWQDAAGHAVLADAVERWLSGSPPPYPVAIGLGGGHYAPRFTEAAFTKQIHFSHMLPGYHAESGIPMDATAKELRRASPDATGVYLHEKSLRKDARESWLEAFASAGLPRLESRSWPVLDDAASFRQAYQQG